MDNDKAVVLFTNVFDIIIYDNGTMSQFFKNNLHYNIMITHNYVT